METYKLSLYDKRKNLIDTTLIKDCSNRLDAKQKVDNLLLSQGLIKAKFIISLKKNK